MGIVCISVFDGAYEVETRSVWVSYYVLLSTHKIIFIATSRGCCDNTVSEMRIGLGGIVSVEFIESVGELLDRGVASTIVPEIPF